MVSVILHSRSRPCTIKHASMGTRRHGQGGTCPSLPLKCWKVFFCCKCWLEPQ